MMMTMKVNLKTGDSEEPEQLKDNRSKTLVFGLAVIYIRTISETIVPSLAVEGQKNKSTNFDNFFVRKQSELP